MKALNIGDFQGPTVYLTEGTASLKPTNMIFENDQLCEKKCVRRNGLPKVDTISPCHFLFKPLQGSGSPCDCCCFQLPSKRDQSIYISIIPFLRLNQIFGYRSKLSNPQKKVDLLDFLLKLATFVGLSAPRFDPYPFETTWVWLLNRAHPNLAVYDTLW